MFNTKKEVISWIQDYFQKIGYNNNVVIGISGGKDSSVVAALCVEALGKDRVYGVIMPNGYQYDIDIAEKLIYHLDINKKIVPIESIINNLIEWISPLRLTNTTEGLKLNDISLNNIPARIRMTVLYAIAATINGRVANTSNLSERYIGWTTKWGDSVGDFSPLGQLTCTEVISLGKELGLPDEFISKVPEDGITGKSDEENFGFSYEVLDKYIRTGECDNIIIKEQINKLKEKSKHKLTCIPTYSGCYSNFE